jgi:hypothetical protein
MSDKDIHQCKADPTTLSEFQNKVIVPEPGEGVLYCKFVFLTPQTLKDNHDLATTIERQPGFVFSGDLDTIKNQFDGYYQAMREQYEAAIAEFQNED